MAFDIELIQGFQGSARLAQRRLGTAAWLDPSESADLKFEVVEPNADADPEPNADADPEAKGKPAKFWIGDGFWGDVDQHLGYVDDRHVCVVSGTRGGKGASVIIPNLCFWPGSCIVVDPKGENATVTARRRGAGSDYTKGLGQTVYVLDPFNVTSIEGLKRSSYNPLDLISRDDNLAIENVGRIASAIVVRGNEKEPFWDDAATGLIKGLILFVAFGDDFDGRRNLVTVWELATQGHQSIFQELRAAKLKEDRKKPQSAFDVLWHSMLKFGSGVPKANDAVRKAINAVGTEMTAMAHQTLTGILKHASTHLEFLSSPLLQSAITRSDFELAELKLREKNPKGMTIYLTLPRRFMETHFRWLRLIVDLAIGELERVRNPPHTKFPTLFVLDEFAGLKRMQVMVHAAAQAAGFRVKFLFVIQTLAQLEEVYEKTWETFLSNAGLRLFFQIDDNYTCKYLSEALGDHETRRTVESHSGATGKTHTKTEGAIDNRGTTTSTGKTDSKGSSDSEGNTESDGWVTNEGTTTSTGRSDNRGETKNHSDSDSESDSSSDTFGRSSTRGSGRSTSRSRTGGPLLPFATGWSDGSQDNWSDSKAESVNRSTSSTRGKSTTRGSSNTTGSSDTNSRSESTGSSKSGSKTESKTRTENKGETKSEGESKTEGRSESSGKSDSESSTETKGQSEALHRRRLANSDELSRSFSRIDNKLDQHYPGFVLALIAGRRPLIARRVNYYDSPFFDGTFDPHPDHPPPDTLKQREEKRAAEQAEQLRLEAEEARMAEEARLAEERARDQALRMAEEARLAEERARELALRRAEQDRLARARAVKVAARQAAERKAEAERLAALERERTQRIQAEAELREAQKRADEMRALRRREQVRLAWLIARLTALVISAVICLVLLYKGAVLAYEGIVTAETRIKHRMFDSVAAVGKILPSQSQPKAVVVAPNSPQRLAFQEGAAARRDWELWFRGLSGDYKAGAEFWASERSLSVPGSCDSQSAAADADVASWSAGCLAAQERLRQSDLQRKSDPDFWRGWNSY